MKINDVEQLLGISKANIRFYEKQNLLSPARSENGYREYSDEDILRLKEIMILRKLGISIYDIARIQSSDLSLQTAIESNIVQLENQIKSLNGALKISKQIAADPASDFSIEHYWNEIHNEEQNGNTFFSIIHDYRTFMLPYAHAYLKTSPNLPIGKNIILFSVNILTAIIVAYVIGEDLNYAINLMLAGFFFVVIGLLPVYILSIFNPSINGLLKRFRPSTVMLISLFFGGIFCIILRLLLK